jgi:hypothetical protein
VDQHQIQLNYIAREQEYITGSNMPEDIKQEKLQQLEENKKLIEKQQIQIKKAMEVF